MDLSNDLISKFVKITSNQNNKKSKEGTVYGTITEFENKLYVKIDGSDLLTPINSTADVKDGERVTIMIKDHNAVVTGNITSPSASSGDVKKVTQDVAAMGGEIAEFETVIAKKVGVDELDAEVARINELIAGKANVEDLSATNAEIVNLQAKDAEIINLVAGKAEIDDLTAANAEIESLKAKDAEISSLVAGKANITDLDVINADIVNLKAKDIETDTLIADKASIGDLNAVKADINELEAGKADVDVLNAAVANIETLTSDLAIIDQAIANKANIGDLNATNAQVADLQANKADVADLNAANAEIDILQANKADVTALDAAVANINTALIDKANVSDLNAANARIDNLQSTKADIDHLNANFATIEQLNTTNANVGTLDAEVADIQTLVNGNLTSDNIASLNLTSANTTIQNAMIKDAMIDSVTASKLTAGEIDTNEITIKSTDGSMILTGSVQQFKDENGTIRIQIGKDGEGNFTFVLYDETGNGVLIDESGIKSSNAIADGLIVDAKVADNANIAGSKLDIASVVTEVNNGTTTIKSNKIYLDGENQTLDVAFNQMQTNVDANSESIQTNTTALSVQNGQINTLISENQSRQTEIANLSNNLTGSTTEINNKYSALEQDLNSFKTTVGESYATKQSVTDVNNNLTSNYSTTAAMNSAINQKANEITQSVSETYTTKEEFNGLQIGGTNLLPETDIRKYGLGYWMDNDGNSIYVDGADDSGYPTIRIIGTTGARYRDYIALKRNTVYTYSMQMICDKDITCDANGPLHMHLVADRFNPTELHEEIYLSRPSGMLEASKWHKVSVTFRTPDNQETYYMKPFIYQIPGDCYFYFMKPQVEEGSRATDWSPAPSDIDNRLDATNNNLQNNYSTTSAMNSAITQKANEITQTVSETYATKQSVTDVNNNLTANYSTTEAMNSAITQKANEITQTVSETYATKQSVTDVNNNLSTNYSTTDAMNSAITQKANEITQTVSETYATKQSVTDVNNNLSANYSTTSAMNSAIQQKANEINQTVSETYTTKTEFNGLQIGGVNLVLWSEHIELDSSDNGNNYNSVVENDYVKITPTNNGNVYNYNVYTSETRLQGETYTLSFEVLTPDDIGFYWYPSEAYATENNRIKASSKWQTVTHTYTQTGADNANAFLFGFHGLIAGHVYYYRRLKLERGNKPTAWSPAPSDFQVQITDTNNNLQNNYSTTAAMNSAITQKANEITQTVSETYATKQSVTDINNNLSTNYSTTSAMNSAIEQKANEITSSVSETYTTKSEFNNLQIGGANLFPNSGNFKDNYGSWVSNGSNITLETVIKYNGYNTIKIDNNSDGGIVCDEYISLKPNTTYTYSITAVAAGVVAGDSLGPLHMWVYPQDNPDNSHHEQILDYSHVGIGTRWGRSYIVFKTPDTDDFYIMRPFIYRTEHQIIYVANFKVEEGNRPTAWSPAPEDIQSQIDATNNNLANNYSTTSTMNSAINQKANEITSSVSETYATKQSVTDINNNLSTNYSTTSAMNSAINQKANEITQTVSQNYATKQSVTDVSNNLATNYSTTESMNSAINQKANEITQTVSQTYTTKTEFDNMEIGGTNLVHNGNFKGAAAGGAIPKWPFWGNDIHIYQAQGAPGYNYPGCVYIGSNLTDGSRAGIYSNRIHISKVEKGATYMASFILTMEGNVKSSVAYIEYLNADVNQIMHSQVLTTGRYVTDIVNGLNDHYYHIPFTMWDGDFSYVQITFNHGGTNAVGSGYLMIVGNVQIEKGNKATNWSPAPEDIQEQIDDTNNNLVNNYSTTAAMNSAITQKANEITQTVSETYATKATVNDLNNNLANNYSTTASMNSAIEQKSNQILSTVSETYATNSTVNNVVQLAKSMGEGLMLNTDATFRTGNNGIEVYNNNLNDTVTVNRIASPTGCPTTSGYCLEVKSIGNATPGYGGIYFVTYSRASAIFITKIIAKIPEGAFINFASNNIGWAAGDGDQRWLTPNRGTGKWEEYIYYVKCGSSGEFSTTNFYYISDVPYTVSAENPLIWHVAYATVFDITDTDERITNLTNDLANNYSTTSQMNSAIEQKSNQILSTVSRTYTTKYDSMLANDGTTGLNRYLFERYAATGSEATNPTIADLNGKLLVSSELVTDPPPHTGDYGDSYIGVLTFYLYYEYDYTYTVPITTDDGGSVYLNDTIIAQTVSCQQMGVTFNMRRGLNKVMIVYIEGGGGDGVSWGGIDGWKYFGAYATTVMAKVNADFTTTSHMNSAIDQKANEITQTVSETYTTKSEFSNLEVGGRNLIQNGQFLGAVNATTTIPKWWFWNPDGSNLSVYHANQSGEYTRPGCVYLANTTSNYACIVSNKIPRSKVEKGVKYTISYTLEHEANVKSTSSRLEFYNDNGWVTNIDLPRSTSLTNDNNPHIKTYTFTMPDVDFTYFQLEVYHEGSNSSTGGYLIVLGNVKLEKGNKATDWSPAPEDIQGQIDDTNNNLANNYSTTAQMNSAINQKANEITSSVSSTYATKTELANLPVSGSVNLLRRSSDFGDPTIWRQERADLTTLKYRGCRVYQTPYEWADYGYVVNDLMNRGVIEANVNYTFSCYIRSTSASYTPTIGFYGHADYHSGNGTNCGTATTSWQRISVTFYWWNLAAADYPIRFEAWTSSTDGSFIQVAGMKLEKGDRATDWTPSPEDGTEAENRWLFEMYSSELGASSSTTAYPTFKDILPGAFVSSQLVENLTYLGDYGSNYLGKLTASFYFEADSTQTKTVYTDDNSTWYLNGATIGQAYTCAATSITFNFKKGWNKLTVLWLEGTGGDGVTIEGGITGYSRMNAYNVGNIDETGIYLNYEMSTGYATKSEVSQTSTDLTIKFTESGGYNLLRNGHANKGTSYWVDNGGGISVVGGAGGGVHGNYFATSMPGGIHYYDWVRLHPNTHYVYQAKIWTQTPFGGNYSVPLHWWFSTNAADINDISATFVDWSTNVDVSGSWTQCYVHFVTPNQDVYMRPFFYGVTAEPFYVSEIMLSESRVVQRWSPHPDEIYDGITQIDKDGIRVQHSNFNGYTHMAPSGFFVNHNGADVVSLDASGLRVSGSITASSGNIAHYTINEHALVGANVGLCGSPDYGYWALWAGSSDSGSAPFRVGHAGQLYASSGHISGSMAIDGNCLINGTVSASKLCIGDYNNYSQLTKGRNLVNVYGTCTWSGSGSHYYWSCSNDYLPFTETGARNPFKLGDTILFDFEAYSQSYRGWTTIGVWFYSDDNSSAYLAEQSTGFDMRADWNRYQVELTLNSEYVKSASTIAILMVISGNYTEVRNVVISRKVGGELIVNGSITADKIAVDAISGKTITGGSISGTYIYGNTIEGGSISGTSISGTTFVSAGTDANSYQYQTMTLNSGSLTMTGAIVGGTNDGQEANRTYVTSMGLIVKDSSYNGFGGNANVFYTNTGIYWNSKATGGEEWPSWRQLIGYYDDYLLLDNMPFRMTKEIYASGICTGYTNIYIGPASDGEAKVVALDSAWGVTNAEMNFRPIRASAFYRKDGKHAYINATGGGTTTDASSALVANGVRTDATDFFLGVAGRLRVTDKNGYNSGNGMTYKPVMASAFENGSDLMFKKNIRTTDDLDAIDILNNVEVYRYDMIGGNDNQIGLIAQECPPELVSGTPYSLDIQTANEISDEDRQTLVDPDNGGASIDLYHMASILWKVCKEQQKRIENLEDLLKGEDE